MADPKTTVLHSIRVDAGAWMVRAALSVLPPGDTRETLRMACAVWLKLMEARTNGRRV